MTPERLHKLRWWSIYSACGFFVFVLGLYFAFPYERAKDMLVARLAAEGVEMEAGAVGAALGPGIKLEDVKLRMVPKTPGAKAARFLLSSARIMVSPLSLLFGSTSYDVHVDGLGGTIDFSMTQSKSKASKMALRAHEVNLSEIPKETVSLPLFGNLDFEMKMASPSGRNADVAGSLEWTCNNCVLGDGKQPLKVQGNAFLEAGLTLPRIRLGDFGGRATVEKGTARLQGVKASSPDLELLIEGEVQLRDPASFSQLNLYIRFRPSDKLLAASEPLKMMLQVAAAAGKRPDGFYGVRLSGRVGAPDAPVFTPTAPSFSAPLAPSTSRMPPRGGPMPSAPPPVAPPPAPPSAPPPVAPPPAPPAAPPPAPPPPTPPTPTPPTPNPAAPAPPPSAEDPRRIFRGVPPAMAGGEGATPGPAAESPPPPPPPAPDNPAPPLPPVQ